MPSAFAQVFDLLDHRGRGLIQQDAVDSFCAMLEKAPPKIHVHRIFKEHDKDMSGEIDSEEFLDFLTALEELTSLSADKMAKQFTTRLARKLFDMIDQAGDGSGEINKAEFRQWYDMNFEVLKGSLPVSEVSKILSSWPGEGFRPENFEKIILKAIQGQQMSKIVDNFSKALESKKKAKDKFKGGAAKVIEMNRGLRAMDDAVAKKEAEERAHQVLDLDSLEERGDVFKEAFSLLDSRGGGSISIDAIYEFCDSLPNPPGNNPVKKIYNQFDEDGSGDIDIDEFQGLCTALEELTNLPAAQMVAHYTKAQYQRLFELVDDGGDSNASISKDELKILLESISPLLSTKYTAADVHNLIKGYDGELNFDAFVAVVSKLTAGKSISQVVAAFEEARRRRKAAKHSAMARFEHGKAAQSPNSKNGGDLAALMDAADDKRICFSCLEKDEKIKEQQKLIDQLQGELNLLKSSASATGEELAIAKQAMEWAKNAADDDLTGNPFAKVRSMALLHSASSFKRYPELIKPALFEYSTNRVLDHARFFCSQVVNGRIETDSVVRSANEVLPVVAEARSQLQALVAQILPNAETIHVFLQQLLDALIANNKEEITGQLDTLSALRDKIKIYREDANFALDRVIQVRTRLSDAAATVAPLTTRAQQIMETLIEFEGATQHVTDMVTVLMMYGSDHITDIEFIARKMLARQKESLSSDESSDLTRVLQQVDAQLKIEKWDAAFSTMKKTTDVLSRHLSLSTQTMRSKAIQTLPQVDMRPLSLRGKKGQDEDRPDDWDNNGYSTPRSAAPRTRAMKSDPRNIVQHVDKIVDRYIAHEGVAVPDNFKRLDPNKNTFQFGTKKIDLMPVDQFVAVKVGGGYLLFDEFCEKYCAAENRRFELATTPRASGMHITRSATPSYGRQTPRSNYGGDSPGPSTPRVLVRQGNSLKIT